MMNLEKLELINQNEELKKEIGAAGTIDELAEVLARYNIELSDEEIASLIDAPEGELNEDSLDQVAGGCLLPRHRRIRIVFTKYPPYIRIIYY